MSEILFSIINSIEDINTSITLCLVFTIFDTITGVYKHYKKGDFKSSEVRKGFLNKISWYLAILFGYVIFIVIKNNLLLFTITIACLFSEGSSIVENFRDLGITLNKEEENKDEN